jgi:AraC-like DNA-binding protein
MREIEGEVYNAPMSAVFSTAGLNASRQFQYFREAICETVARLGARRGAQGPYDAEIRTGAFGPMDLAEVRCDPVIIERTPHDISIDSGAWYFLTLQLEGRGRVQQRGRSVVLHPGDYTLVDGSEPYTLEFDAAVRRLVVRIPHREIDCRAGQQADFRAIAYGRSAGGSALVFNMLRSLVSECMLHPPQVKASLAASVLDLSVTAMLARRNGVEPGLPGTLNPARSRVLARVREHASAHLRDPDLTPATAAAAAGISVRYLHQLFHGSGQSFGNWVRDQRLQRCHAAIADPAQAGRSISEIAFSYGFNDTAHFSRVFARSFGYPPRALRARAG